MNTVFSNIWNHPKTSIAGVLICLTTIAGVFSQQGITLGNAGTGTVVALIASIAGAFLGLLSKDPGSGSAGGAATGAMIAFLCISLCVIPVVGCTQAQKVSVAQEIVDLGPAITSGVNTASATASMLFPEDAIIFNIATAGFDTLSAGVQQAAKDYLANPNQTTLAFLQAEIVKFQQSTNTALLQVAGIKDPASQKLAIIAINGIATVVNTVLGLVQSISTKAQVAAMAAQVHVTLAQVRPLLDQRALQASADRVSHDLALNHAPTVDQFFAYEAQAGF